MDIGEKIREIRVGRNLTQTELAARTGLTLRTIQRIENNEVKPSIHSLRALSNVLEADLTENGSQPESSREETKLIIKVIDMTQLFNDLKMLISNNWKVLLVILIITLFLMNYTDIKSGIIDGWTNK